MIDALASAPPCLESLVAEATDDFMARLSRGERPKVEEHAQRYPEISDVLRQVLPALQLMRGSVSGLPAALDLSSASLESAAPLGDYRIVREVGRGGMGVVYEAEQLSLGRRVALKVLPFAAALDPKQLQRFKNEAQAAGALQHPNIVPIHAVGAERGVHYYAMQFIDGQSVAGLIAELRQLSGKDAELGEVAAEPISRLTHDLMSGRWAPAKHLAGTAKPTGTPGPSAAPAWTAEETAKLQATVVSTQHSAAEPAYFRTVAKLGIQAAEALEHAHQLGVIHRDVKPANLLVDLGGNLWVTDFGLAQFRNDARLTLSGELLGTLRYMSPEQALAQRVGVDQRSDIYSLGVTLYELLTLEPACNGDDRQELLRQITFEEPRPPRQLSRAIPAELETVVLKAMAKNPDERYAVAQELADDLERFLSDQPIKARRPTYLQRLRRWSRRHRAAAVAAVLSTVVVLLMAIAFLTISNVWVWQEQAETKKALVAQERANDELQQALERERRTHYALRLALARHAWRDLKLQEARRHLDQCPPELRDDEWHYLTRVCQGEVCRLEGAATVFTGVAPPLAYSPDGRCLATGSANRTVCIWDANTGALLFKLSQHESVIAGLAFSPDGEQLISTSFRAPAIWGPDPASPNRLEGKVWDLKTKKEVASFTQDYDRLQRVCLSADGRRVALFGPEWLRICDARDGQELHILHTVGLSTGQMVFQPDGHRMALTQFRGNPQLWDFQTGRVTPFGNIKDRVVVMLALSRDGRQLAAALYQSFALPGEVKVWDTQTQQEVVAIPGLKSTARCIAFSPDGRRLALGGDRDVVIWDLDTDREVLTFRGHAKDIRNLAFSPDGQRLTSIDSDGSVRIWDVSPLPPRDATPK